MLNPGDWMFWLTALGVVAVNAALVYVAWWALFADRPRGRRRCPRCWYDLAYSPGMTCAECGFTASRESQFHTTRRRYRIAAGAILASACIAALISERASQRGLLSFMPTHLLIWLLPLAEHPQQGIFAELLNRQVMNRLSHDQQLALIRRCAGGDWWSKPPDDAWVMKYGDYLWSLRPRLTGTPLETPLIDIPPRIEATTRDVWPVDTPVTISLQVRDWWPFGTECRVTATPRIEGIEPVIALRSGDIRYTRTPLAISLPPLNSATSSVEIDVQIERRRMLQPSDESSGEADAPSQRHPEDSPSWELVARQTLVVPTRAQGALHEHLQAVSDANLASFIANVFRGGVVQWAQGRSPVRYNVDAPQTFVPELNDVALGLKVELLCDGMVARRLHMWWIAGDTSPAGALPGQWPRLSSRGYGFEIDYEDEQLLRQLDPQIIDRWSMRITSDPHLALRAGNVKKFWQGEITVPVRAQLRDEPAPPRPWRTP